MLTRAPWRAHSAEEIILSASEHAFVEVTQDAELAGWCDRIASTAVLAMDTEFIRVRTYHPQPALLQLSDGMHHLLIDPLSLSRLQPLASCLGNPQQIKVFHAAGEDLEVCRLLFDLLPRPLFDTQVAAAFVGLGFSMGYQRLVEQLLGISLEKGESRSDWLQRPLTQAQKHYAAQDVIHLHSLHQMLQERLLKRGYARWFEAEMERTLLEAERIMAPEERYLQLRAAQPLSTAELAILRSLAAWREVEAVRRDLPRGFVLNDRTLIDLVRQSPSNISRLNDINDLHPSVIRHHGETLLQLIAAAQAEPIECHPPLLSPMLDAEQKARLQRLKEQLKVRAQQLDIAVELLASSRELSDWILSRSNSGAGVKSPRRLIEGWRFEAIGDLLTAG